MSRMTAALIALAAGASVALAQPGGPSPRPRDREPMLERDGPPEPGALREMLSRRLEEAARSVESLQKALAALDAGASPEDVLRDIEPRARRFGPGRTPGEGFGPEGGRREWDRPDPEGPRAGDGGGGGGRIDPDAARAFLKEHLPDLAAKFDALAAAEPEMAERLMMRMAPKIRETISLKEREPELFALRVQELGAGARVMDAMRSFREARGVADGEGVGSERLAKARAALRESLADHFDVRLKLQEHEVAQIAKRLERMRSEIESRRAKRDAEIGQMLDRAEQGSPPEGDRPRPRDGVPKR